MASVGDETGISDSQLWKLLSAWAAFVLVVVWDIGWYTGKVVEWETVGVLVITVLAIGWYSYETRWLRQETARLHREAVEQRKQQIRPSFTAGWLSEDDVLAIRNVGLASAREITFGPVPVPTPNSATEHSLQFLALTALEVGEYAKPPWALQGPPQNRVPGIACGDQFAKSVLGQGGVPQAFELRVFYRSISRVPYLVRFRVTREIVWYLREDEITEAEWPAGW